MKIHGWAHAATFSRALAHIQTAAFRGFRALVREKPDEHEVGTGQPGLPPQLAGRVEYPVFKPKRLECLVGAGTHGSA